MDQQGTYSKTYKGNSMKERITYISIIFALIVIAGLSMRECSSKKTQLQQSQQNIDALLDSTRKTKNKLGQLQFEKTSFMADIETLKKLNADLVDEVEKQKGRVRVVTRVVTKFVFDTIYLDNKVSKIDDSTFNVSFSYLKQYDTNNSIGFNGSLPAQVKKTESGYELKSSKTTITDIDLRMKLFTGIKEEGGKYSIFARTDFPGVEFDLDGAVVDPQESFVKTSKSPFSLMLGGGIGYGITSSGAAIVPNVGVYIGINLFNF